MKNKINLDITCYRTMGEKLSELLTLKHGEVEYKLKFNCKPCEMEIWEKDAELVLEDED